MMSRRNTLPVLSSSRQMMTAWKVSGLSQRPAIMASRPASMRLAIALLPSRANLAQIQPRRFIGPLGRLLAGRGGQCLGLGLDQLAVAVIIVLGGGLFL